MKRRVKAMAIPFRVGAPIRIYTQHASPAMSCDIPPRDISRGPGCESDRIPGPDSVAGMNSGLAALAPWEPLSLGAGSLVFDEPFDEPLVPGLWFSIGSTRCRTFTISGGEILPVVESTEEQRPGTRAGGVALGFNPIGVYRNAGWEHGQWHEVEWWQLQLRELVADPPASSPFPRLTRGSGKERRRQMTRLHDSQRD